MQFKSYFFLACLLAATFLGASPNAPISSEPSVSSSESGQCNLPAPTNFNVVATGPTWVKFDWMPSNAANAHRIRVFRVVDNFLLSTTIVPNGVIGATITIPGDTPCYGKINTICNDGSNSPFDARSIDFLGLILDLVIQGFTDSNLPGVCTLDMPNQECRYNLPGSANFRVQLKNFESFSRGFSMTKNPTTAHQVLQCDGSENDEFLIHADHQPPEVFGANEYEIKFTNGVVVARFEAILIGGTGNVAAIKLKWIKSGFEIVCLTPYNEPPPLPVNPSSGSTYQRDGASRLAFQAVTTSPNPFTEFLDVSLSPSIENIHVQLFNLSGQKVLDQRFSGGQEQYSLSTEGLSTGFYLLRIEADGEVQTLKVVKSE